MDLGDLGEKSFARWCAEVDLCASRPDRDRTGWDYLVEFPAGRPTEAVPLDLAPPELTCKVQVKATRKVAAFPGISLANWKRLVQAPIPAFVILIKFDAQTTVEEVFLLHVDERVVREVLKRLRELEAGERPHKKNYKPPLDWATRLSSPSGPTFLGFIGA